MNKDQEILAIGRLVFELTKISDGSADLDKLLERLSSLLASLPGIAVQPKNAILLVNPHGRLVQVAQTGLPPAWEERSRPVRQAATQTCREDGAYLGTPAGNTPPLHFPETDADAPCFMLPLHSEGRFLGLCVLFIDPAWQPTPIEHEFMSDLAQALSTLISRVMITETLRVREIELEEARTDAIRRLGAASEYRDNETGMHVMRMTHYATAIARAMQLPQEMCDLLAVCAPMHDVGKIGIPDAILLKPGRLTPEEFEIMKTHTELGKRLLDGEDALIRAAGDIAACHHERWDGSGYPHGLAGEEIPVLARVCAIADVFDALTSLRPYKQPWPMRDAIEWIREQSGTQFDPVTVTAFLAAVPEIRRIRHLYRDDIIDPNQDVELPPARPRNNAWVNWTEDLTVGIEVIDEHHRHLFDLTNDLHEVVTGKLGSRETARILKALDRYAQVHFRAEERMMEHYRYASLDQQEYEHTRFVEKLQEFYAELHDNPLTAQFDVLLYLRDWLINHIRHEDTGLRSLVGQADG